MFSPTFLYLFLKLGISLGIADCDKASSCLWFLILCYYTLIKNQPLYVHLELNHRRIVKCGTVNHFGIELLHISSKLGSSPLLQLDHWIWILSIYPISIYLTEQMLSLSLKMTLCEKRSRKWFIWSYRCFRNRKEVQEHLFMYIDLINMHRRGGGGNQTKINFDKKTFPPPVPGVHHSIACKNTAVPAL